MENRPTKEYSQQFSNQNSDSKSHSCTVYERVAFKPPLLSKNYDILLQYKTYKIGCYRLLYIEFFHGFGILYRPDIVELTTHTKSDSKIDSDSKSQNCVFIS